MTIRTETRSDYEQVYSLHQKAFGSDNESKLVERIRASDRFIPELSVVAESDGAIVGHLLLSKASVIGEQEHEAIVLAPIAVRPDVQKRGVGRSLIEEGMKRCREMKYGVILLIGHPSYYPQFGWSPARRHGLELTQFPVSDDVFMVNEIIPGELAKVKGELKYPQAFFG